MTERLTSSQGAIEGATQSAGHRPVKLLIVAALGLGYVALQGLYLGPTYGSRSPVQGLLESQECLSSPLCDNDVLRFNHVGVLALIACVGAVTAIIRRSGPPVLLVDRPNVASSLGPTAWRPSLRAPGFFCWLTVLSLVTMATQTAFGNGTSATLWVATSAFGMMAAWSSDRASTIASSATLASLCLGASCLLVPLGLGSVWLDRQSITGSAVLAIGLVLFGCALYLLGSSDSSFDAADYAAMLGLSVLATVLGLLRHDSWRYAFVGDEWTFYQSARDEIAGNQALGTFEVGGPNDYFTGLTFQIQAAIMRVAGTDVSGWRLSSLLPLAVSVAAMYAFTRWLGGKTAALFAATALACGHMLLSFSMIGYNNTQALAAVSASLATFAWAHQRPSALRSLLLGTAVGSTFLVFAVARLALLPIAILFVVAFRHDLQSMARRLGWVSLGAVAIATPALFSWRNWDALLGATPLEAENAVLESGDVARQVVENTFSGWLAFIGSANNTHFVVGPHLDVISAALLIIGFSYFVAKTDDPMLRAFLIGGVGLLTATAAIQQYAAVSNTRSFLGPLIYCVFAGCGASAVISLVRDRLDLRWASAAARLTMAGALALAIMGLNQWHISSHANNHLVLTEQAILVQQFEATEGVGGQGMPVYVGWPEETNALLSVVLRAHDVAADRIIVIPEGRDLAVDQLCATQDPLMLIMHPAHPQAVAWTEELAQCWESTVHEITDPSGGLKLLRTTNGAGAAEFDRDASDRFGSGVSSPSFVVADTVDVATDGSGTAFVLSRSAEGAAIHRLDGGGTFAISQTQPIAFDITSDGLFVVAANGSSDRLVWYDAAGNVVQSYAGRDSLPVIGDIAVNGGRLWLSDTTNSRLVAIDRLGSVDEVRDLRGVVIGPSSIAPGADGAVWVFSGGSGEIVLVDESNRASLRLPARIIGPEQTPRLASTAEGWLIRVLPQRPAVELIDLAGHTVDVRSGLYAPVAAAARAGELVVADPRWGDVPVLKVDGRWAPSERGVVAWGEPASAPQVGIVTIPTPSTDQTTSDPQAIDVAPTLATEVAPGQVWRPIGAAVLGEVHAIGIVADGGYVSDIGGNVVRLDRAGASLGGLAIGGRETFVTDMVTDADGAVWLLDAGLGRIVRIDGQAVTALESDPTPLIKARGMGPSRDGGLWVASTAGAGLVKLASDGTLLATVSLPGRQPTDVVELDDGSLWIVDAERAEVVHLTSTGTPLGSMSIDVFSSRSAPHLAASNGMLWVTEPEMSALFAIDLTTNERSGRSVELRGPAGALVDKAVGIATSPDGRIWVTDSLNRAVVLLES